jgi:hypothetical protein
VCMRTILTPYLEAISLNYCEKSQFNAFSMKSKDGTLILSTCSHHIPNEAAGPPTSVLKFAPLPRPGFSLTPQLRPGYRRPNSSSWCREHALNSIPRSYSSEKFTGNSWEDKLICEGLIPARIALMTSYPLEASK